MVPQAWSKWGRRLHQPQVCGVTLRTTHHVNVNTSSKDRPGWRSPEKRESGKVAYTTNLCTLSPSVTLSQSFHSGMSLDRVLDPFPSLHATTLRWMLWDITSSLLCTMYNHGCPLPRISISLPPFPNLRSLCLNAYSCSDISCTFHALLEEWVKTFRFGRESSGCPTSQYPQDVRGWCECVF